MLPRATCSKLITCTIVAGIFAVFSAGCRPTDQSVIGQANQVHGSLQPAVITDPQIQDYMDRIGKRIIEGAIAYDAEGKEIKSHKGQDNDWMYDGKVRFHLVNSKTLNAFTTGGTHVYIYNQLFQDAKSEDEFAGVMAHEFAHIYARHVHSGTERQYIPIAFAAAGAAAGLALGGSDNRGSYATAGAGLGAAGGTLFTNSFTRDDENEADKLGFSFYSRAGWDPAHFADFFKQMIAKGYDKTPELVSDHPSLANRVKATEERIERQSSEVAKWRRPPIANPQQFRSIQDRAMTVARNTPDDKSLAAAQLMLQAFPSCVTSEDQPDQKMAQRRLLQAVQRNEGRKR